MKKILLLFLALLPALLVGSCTKKENTSSEKNLILDNYADPEYLDPTMIHAVAGSKIAFNLFEGLTSFDPKTLEPRPGVAEKWKVSEDGKTYTFFLRPHAKWSDGTPVTAHDFVYSWRRAADPKTASIYSFLLFFVKNGEAINSGKIGDITKLGIKALDDQTFQVELENPTPFFLSVAGWTTLMPLKQSIVEQYGDRWTRPEHMVSNGPFRLVEWTPQTRVVVEPNPHYWDRKKVKLDRAIFLPLEDRETAIKMFLNGEIHFIYEVPNLRINSVKNHLEFINGPYLGTLAVVLNTSHKPLNDKRVRQALSMAIDREQITKITNKGIPHEGWVPLGLGDYTSPNGLGFNPEKARALLADAGFADPKTFPKLTVIYNTHQDYKLILETLQSMWKQHLGIEVMLQNMEWKSYLKALKSGDFDIGRSGWIGDYYDPNTFLDMYMTGNGNNYSRWTDPRYDVLLKKAAETLNHKARMKSFQEAEAILLDEYPLISLYTWTLPIMVSQNVVGLHHNMQNIHPLKEVDLKN